MDYVEHFVDYFDSNEVEFFEENGVEYFEGVIPSFPEMAGCRLVTEGRAYDMGCKDNEDMDGTKPCLVYACPDVNLTDPVWNQRKAAITQHYKTSGCDDKKIFVGPSMKLNGERLYNGFCNKFDMETGTGLPP